MTAMLRWQNDQGRRMREEYSFRNKRKQQSWFNSSIFSDWLLNPESKNEPEKIEHDAEFLFNEFEKNLRKTFQWKQSISSS